MDRQSLTRTFPMQEAVATQKWGQKHRHGQCRKPRSLAAAHLANASVAQAKVVRLELHAVLELGHGVGHVIHESAFGSEQSARHCAGFL